VLKMRWGKDAHDMIFEGAKPGIKFALGENPKRAGNPNSFNATASRRYPATRMGVEDVIREAFTEAKQYRQSWSDYQAKAAKGEAAIPPRRDLKLEPLVEVLEGNRIQGNKEPGDLKTGGDVLQEAGTNVEILPGRRHGLSVVHRGVDRRTREHLGKDLDHVFGATPLVEVVVDNGHA